MAPPVFLGQLCGRVGADRPLRDHPYPPLANRACTFPRTRLSPSPGYWCEWFRGSISTPHFPVRTFSQAPLACFLPNSTGFASVPWVSPAVGTHNRVCTSHYSRTLRNTMPPSPCRDDSLFRGSRLFSRRRSGVLQVSVRPYSPRSKGLPEELERAAEIHSRPIFWSSVSVIFRWRPPPGQRNWSSTNPGLTIHALH